MEKTVVLVGALDTKGREFAFVKSLIEEQGVRVVVIDFGVMDAPAILPDITREEVARAGGKDLAVLANGESKDEAMAVMSVGLAKIVRRLYADGRLNAILGMGGGGGTSISTSAMRVLPIGIPKPPPPLSRPGESHPQPLTEPYVTVSRHTALVTQPYLHMPSSQ